MRRLTVLPCPERWERMQDDGDGRFCERCQLRVTEVAKLDDGGVDELLAAVEGGRVCASFELDGGRPRTRAGLAAGLVVVALAGCASPGLATPETVVEPEPEPVERDADDLGGIISGAVRHSDGSALSGAVVILQSTSLEAMQERITNERGLYKFKSLPPGTYTIQVFYERASVSKITVLPENTRSRANFSIDPENAAFDTFLGLVVEEQTLDTTSASSTFSSDQIEYD